MSLDKAIQHGKEYRKSYRGSKAIDCACRNHGSCVWCRENRLHKFKKSLDKMADMEYNTDNESEEYEMKDYIVGYDNGYAIWASDVWPWENWGVNHD